MHSLIAVTSDSGLMTVFYAEGIGSRSVGLSEVLSFIYEITWLHIPDTIKLTLGAARTSKLRCVKLWWYTWCPFERHACLQFDVMKRLASCLHFKSLGAESLKLLNWRIPITVAAKSKALTVIDFSNYWDCGLESLPRHILRRRRSLAMGQTPFRGSYKVSYRFIVPA